METPLHMDIARSAGVTMVGHPNIYRGTLVIGEPPANSYIVFRSTDGQLLEAYISAGALALRATTVPDRDPNIGSFGKRAGGGPVGSCMWVRGLGDTVCGLVDAGVVKVFGVTNAGLLGSLGALPADPQRTIGITTMGAALEGPSRLVLDSAPGKPSGLILQSPNEIPWVLWVDTTTTLRITNWATFLTGV